MMSFIFCRDKMNFSRNESPNLPSYPSKRIQFIREWPSLSFHIFYVKCPMILLENKTPDLTVQGRIQNYLWGGGGARFDQMSVLTLRIWKDKPAQTV